MHYPRHDPVDAFCVGSALIQQWCGLINFSTYHRVPPTAGEEEVAHVVTSFLVCAGLPPPLASFFAQNLHKESSATTRKLPKLVNNRPRNGTMTLFDPLVDPDFGPIGTFIRQMFP